MWYYNVDTKKNQSNLIESKENNSPSFSGSLFFSYCLNNTYDSPSKAFPSNLITPVCSKHLTVFLKSQPLSNSFIIFCVLSSSSPWNFTWFQILDRGSLKLFIGLYHHWRVQNSSKHKMRQKRNCTSSIPGMELLNT